MKWIYIFIFWKKEMSLHSVTGRELANKFYLCKRPFLYINWHQRGTRLFSQFCQTKQIKIAKGLKVLQLLRFKAMANLKLDKITAFIDAACFCCEKIYLLF